MHSCLYVGQVAHRRFQPLDHGFDYRLTMALVDLDELERGEGVLERLRKNQRGLVSWPEGRHMRRRSDGQQLSDAVRDLVREETGIRPNGPIRLLTQLTHFGFYFSPLNLFYCYDNAGSDVEMVVAEVSNTPWGEQHHYVLWEGNRTAFDAGLTFRHAKNFHVSPFMGMDMDYAWRLSAPGASLSVGIDNMVDDARIFTATMRMDRMELTHRNLTRMALRFPMMTGQIIGAIYWQALKLWWKKCPYYSHPKNNREQAPV